MITVIADDLTGAAEVAGVCLRYGQKVSFGIDSVPSVEADVQIIATDSRSGTVGGAFRVHKLMATRVFSLGDTLVFKKTDSVLRGHVMQELKALMLISGKSTVLLQPSNPAAGRCVRQGQYYVGDALLEDTGFAADPDFPAKTSDVRELLNERVKTRDKRNLLPVITGTVEHYDYPGKVIFTPDCNSEEEMRQSLRAWTPDVLLAGSAAFFEQVLRKVTGAVKVPASPPVIVEDRFLMVCGTAHPEGKAFLRKLKDETDCLVRYFPSQFLQEKISEAEFTHWAKSLVPDWKWSNKMAIALSPVKFVFPGSSAVLRQRMNEVVAAVVKQCAVEELLIEGGATAYSALTFLQWKTLIPEQELEPGVIRMKVGRRPSLYLTIKPGSYPWPAGIAGVD